MWGLERTKTRPLARGDVTQLGALTFLAAQLTMGLVVLAQLNWYSYVPLDSEPPGPS